MWLIMTGTALMPLFSSGCVHRPSILVIPANEVVLPLEPGQTLVVTNRGWFVPDAAMQKLLHRLAEKDPQ